MDPWTKEYTEYCLNLLNDILLYSFEIFLTSLLCISYNCTISITGGNWMMKPYRTYSWKAPADFYKLLRLQALNKKQRKNGGT